MCDLCKDTPKRCGRDPGSRRRIGDEDTHTRDRGRRPVRRHRWQRRCTGRACAARPGATPIFEGIWTNATLTPLQRPPELAGEGVLHSRGSRAVSAHTDRTDQRGSATAARPGRRLQRRLLRARHEHRPQPANLARRRSARRTHSRAYARGAEESGGAAEARERRVRPIRPEDRWLTERCILFGATVPMLPEPYNNNYRIIQSPGYVTILVEMNHDARVIPLDGRPHLSVTQSSSGRATRAGDGRARRSSWRQPT